MRSGSGPVHTDGPHINFKLYKHFIYINKFERGTMTNAKVADVKKQLQELEQKLRDEFKQEITNIENKVEARVDELRKLLKRNIIG